MSPKATVIHGDCIEIMRTMPANSVDSIVTDPPYGLGFMGKKWDELPPGKEWAEECLRVLKPGGHLLAFGGTRTWHRLAVAIEDEGFEIRDSIAWLYGSGFPKSMDVSKAIDKAAGAEREVTGKRNRDRNWRGVEEPDSERYAETRANTPEGSTQGHISGRPRVVPVTAPATEEALKWEGWGTALKPAFEPVVMARKPLVGTVAANVLEYGTGALNIDASRVTADWATDPTRRGWQGTAKSASGTGVNLPSGVKKRNDSGRWPANVILDEGMAEFLDEQSGILKSGSGDRRSASLGSVGFRKGYGYIPRVYEANVGGASRFFYCAKASKKERPTIDGVSHPTVKPLSLMRYLVKLVTPPGGTVLEPFAGSGATVEACLLESFNIIAIERELEYIPLIEARIERTAA